MIKGNNSTEEVLAKSTKYFGIGNFKIVGINLSLEELQEKGFMRTKDPVYEISFGDRDFKKVVFYAVNEEFDIRLPIEFLISDRDQETASGSFRFINNYGTSVYAADQETAESYEWFNTEGLRKAKEGEVELTNFLINWLNVKNFVSRAEKLEGIKPDAAFISDFNKLTKGDFSELEAYFKEYADNEVTCLVHIKDQKYMNIYTKRFGRASSTSLNGWMTYANKQKSQGYPIPGEYYIGNLKEYVPMLIEPDDDEDDDVEGSVADLENLGI